MDDVVSGLKVETVENAQESSTVRAQFDQEKTPASMAVIATLAEVMGVDPVELDPLHSTVDSDALDALVRVRSGTDGDVHATFTHEDHGISVYSDGVVTITPDHGPTAADYGRDAGR